MRDTKNRYNVNPWAVQFMKDQGDVQVIEEGKEAWLELQEQPLRLFEGPCANLFLKIDLGKLRAFSGPRSTMTTSLHNKRTTKI